MVQRIKARCSTNMCPLKWVSANMCPLKWVSTNMCLWDECLQTCAPWSECLQICAPWSESFDRFQNNSITMGNIVVDPCVMTTLLLWVILKQNNLSLVICVAMLLSLVWWKDHWSPHVILSYRSPDESCFVFISYCAMILYHFQLRYMR